MHVVVRNFTVTMEAGNKLFSDFSLELKGPGLYFIIGQNGVGKSTLARILAGLVTPAVDVCGEVLIDGVTYDLATAPTSSYLSDHVVYITQRVDDMIASHFSVRENLAAAMFTRFPGFSRFLKPTLDLFALPENIPVAALSGGQRQLLAIAMAMQKQPSVLILDEPTSALDPQNSILVMDAIKQLSRHMLCLCISHDEQLMARYVCVPRVNL